MAGHVVPKLGHLTSVPIKEIWTSEPYAFDPWLMQPENLQYLAEALGLPGLEVVQAQQQIGPFYADIVCKVIDTDHIVLIENQLDQADHRHLGQVLTYAPHVDAKTCVWVASSIRDEHRAAVDWLNRITAESYSFFGVEVKAVRIGDSDPAPLFEVVAKPNEFSRISITTSDAGSAAAKEQNARYWSEFHKVLVEAGGPLRKVKSDLEDTTYWAPIAGGGRAYIWAFRSLSKKPFVNAGLSLYNAGAAEIGAALSERKEEFTSLASHSLKWSENKTGTTFHIQFDGRPGTLDLSDWRDQHLWLAERMKLLDQALSTAVTEEIVAYDQRVSA